LNDGHINCSGSDFRYFSGFTKYTTEIKIYSAAPLRAGAILQKSFYMTEEAQITGKKMSKGARKLMQTAERLFSEHGIDGVSLRQIVTSAGYANSSAIQHHFGNKEGLLQAVYDMRLPVLEHGRKIRLGWEKKRPNGATLDGLIHAFFMPLVEDFDEKTQATYQQFNTRLLQSELHPHPYLNSRVAQPAAYEILELISTFLPQLTIQVYNVRVRLASELFLSAMAERRRLKNLDDDPYTSDSHYWRDVLQAIQALFSVVTVTEGTPNT